MSKQKPSRPEADDDDDDRDEAPVRKKKKKKKSQAPARWPMMVLQGSIGVLCLVLLVVILWVFMKAAEGGPPARPVTAWEKYSTDDIGFAFDYPAGWGAKGFGIRNQREAEVKGSGATINVKENLTGSLVGDIAGAAAGGQPVRDENLPVAKVHDMRRPKDSSSYKEEPAQTVDTGFGKARRSAYTDGSKRGYRATVLMSQSALDVFCECRASDWDTLRPAFERVIGSIGHGGK